MDVIRAAGGVIVRDGTVVLVHRPKYDDWSFPKGKLDKGETFEEAAVREVREETGLICELRGHLVDVEYPVGDGDRKLVRFWEMNVVGGDVDARTPDREIDHVEWVPLETARTRLTYEQDRRLLERVAQEGCS
jgi:8-oxo-dGTP pyrophosphatase MutT (NUDIX family)